MRDIAGHGGINRRETGRFITHRSVDNWMPANQQVYLLKWNVLIVYSLSRLARSTKDAISIAERLEKAGSDLVSLTERIDTTSAAGKMMFRMLAVLAEFERDLVSERTKAVLADKSAKGERVGQIPCGYKLAADGVSLIEDEGEQATIADIRAMKATGLSWREIADMLNARGVTTKKRRVWTWQTARKSAA